MSSQLILGKGRLLRDGTRPIRVCGAEAIPADTELSTGDVDAAEVDFEKLLTAEELQHRTSIAKSWWLAEARMGRLPCIRAGKYVRFVYDEVVQSLRARQSE